MSLRFSGNAGGFPMSPAMHVAGERRDFESYQSMSQDTSPEKTAELIIDFLHTRKHFCYWWDNIDRETQNEILEGLAGVILSNACIHEWTIDGCVKCGKRVS